MPDPTPTRRERLRAQTFAEIEAHGLALVDTRGGSAVTFAAIAKAMGMSAPALYRYYPSRDALVGHLVTVMYDELVTALEQTAGPGAPGDGKQRLRRVVRGYRAWALEHPRRYQLLFGERSDDVSDSAEAITTVDRGMSVLIAAVAEMPLPAGPPLSDQAHTQLADWADRRGRDASPEVLALGVLVWTRLHGIVSLELAGVFQDMGLSAETLLDAELDRMSAAAAGSPPPADD